MPDRRKRETGAAVASLGVSELVDAITSDTTLEIALRMAETTGAASDAVGTASVAVRLEIADARLSTTEGSTVASAGSVALPPVGKVPLRPVGAAAAASEVMQVEAMTGTVSIV